MAMYQFLELLVLGSFIFNVFAGPVDLSSTTHRQLGVSGHVHMDRVFDAASGQADDVCVIDDVLYRPGDRVPSSADSCEWCVCKPPGFACEPIACQKPVLGCREVQTPGKCCPSYTCDCEVRGRIYQHGQQVETSSQAPCHACYCHLGEVRCTAVRCHQRSDCEPREVAGRCCPSYEHCPSKASTISATQQTFRPPPEFQLPQRQRPGTGLLPISTTISIDIDTESSFVPNVDNNNISTMQPEDIITTIKAEDIQNTDDLIINTDKLETTTNFETSEQNLITSQNTLENLTNNSSEKNIENSSEPEKTAIEEKLSSIFINLESTTFNDKNEQTEENYKLSTFLSVETTTKGELSNENLYTTSTAPVEQGTFKIGSTSLPASPTTFDVLLNNESTPSISVESITDTILVNPQQNDNLDESTLSEMDFIQEAIEAVSINNASDILLKLVEEDKEKITSESSELTTESVYISFDTTTTTKEINEQNIKQNGESTQDNNKINPIDVTESELTTTILYSRNPLDKQEDLDLVENITTAVEDHTEITIPFETTTVKSNDQTDISISESPTEEEIDSLATQINIEIPTETIKTEISTEIVPDTVTENERYTTSDVYIESTNSPITTEKIVEIVELVSDPKVTTIKELEEISVQKINGTQNPTEDIIEITTQYPEVESTTISIPISVDSEIKPTVSDKLDIFTEINISDESDETVEFIKKKILPEILEWKSNVTAEEEHNETKIPDSWLKNDMNNVNINNNVTEHSNSSKEVEKINLNKTSNELNKFNENLDKELQKIPDNLELKNNLSLSENNTILTSSIDLPQVEIINKSVVNISNESSNQKINDSSSEDGKKHILLINKNDSELSEAMLKILPLVKEWKENLTKHEENAESTEIPESDKNISNEELDEVAKKILPEVLEWKTSVSKNDGESDASSIAIPEGWLEDAGIQGGITSFRGDPQEPLKILQDVIKQSQQGGFSSASATIPVKRADLINDQDLVILQEFFKKLYLHENRDN